MYDRRTRELMAIDSRHDPSPVDEDLVIWVNLELLSATADARLQTAPPTPKVTSSMSFGPVPSSSSSRRFTPFDQSGWQTRKPKSQTKCFRCGVLGHTASSCDSKSTTAGLLCAPWTRNPGSISGYLIDRTTGQSFCYTWARRSHCPFAESCIRGVHRCSICGDVQHGANACPK